MCCRAEGELFTKKPTALVWRGTLTGMTLRFALFLFSLASSLGLAAQCEGYEVAFTSSTGQWGQEMTWELYHFADGDTALVGDFEGT